MQRGPIFVPEQWNKIEGSRPEWCISSMIYSRDTPFWSETLEIITELNTHEYNGNTSYHSNVVFDGFIGCVSALATQLQGVIVFVFEELNDTHDFRGLAELELDIEVKEQTTSRSAQL